MNNRVTNIRMTSDEWKCAMLITRRSTTGSDKFTIYKTLLLVVGLAFFLVGIRLEQSWPVWVAVAFVGIAFLLRFVPGSTGMKSEERRANSEERKEKPL